MSELENPSPKPEEFLALILHQEMRNYDVLMHILRVLDSSESKHISNSLKEIHENMEIWGPPPFLIDDQVEE